MVACPSCGATIEGDFGMVTCPDCESVFMIDIDGGVKRPDAEEFEVSPEAAPPDESLEATEVDGSEPIEVELPEAVDDEATSFGDDEPTMAAAADASTEDTVLEDAPLVESAYSEDFLDNLGGSDTTEPNDETTLANDPLGVTKFDGTENSQLVDGPYYYDVLVSGIDTATLKQQVVEALTDRRLNWSQEDIKKNIKRGQLQLLNLNPVRAVLAVLKLQPLDVDVEWDQKLFTQDADRGNDQEMS